MRPTFQIELCIRDARAVGRETRDRTVWPGTSVVQLHRFALWKGLHVDLGGLHKTTAALERQHAPVR